MKISSILTTLILLTALIVRITLIFDSLEHNDCMTASSMTTDNVTYSACECGLKYFLNSYGARTGYSIGCNTTYAPYLNTFACILRELSRKELTMLMGSLFLGITLAFLLVFGRDRLISRLIATFSLWLTLNGAIFSSLEMVLGSIAVSIFADNVVKILLKILCLISMNIENASSPFHTQKTTPTGCFSS